MVCFQFTYNRFWDGNTIYGYDFVAVFWLPPNWWMYNGLMVPTRQDIQCR